MNTNDLALISRVDIAKDKTAGEAGKTSFVYLVIVRTAERFVKAICIVGTERIV